jgi:lantibiotic modifying enzyme
MTEPRARWRPIVDGTAATALRAQLDEIAAALAPSSDSASLCDGAAGRALFFAYLAQAFSDERWGELAAQHLEQAVALVGARPIGAALFTGFTGVAWTVEHLQGHLLGPDEADPNHEADAALAEIVATTPWPGDYDLIAGLTGLGLYALERAARPSGRRCLELVIDRLAELAEPQRDGITWLTRPALMVAETRAQHPDGNYNLGVAHGVPAVIALLAASCQAGVAVATARPLVDGAVRWVLKQRRADEDSTFPVWVTPDQRSPPARSAWCYGDPGVAAALLWAARAAGDERWADAALAVARKATARAPADTGVVDAGLCHGSAGLLHIYNRLYQASGEPLFAAAARDELTRTLALRQPGTGVAGYRSWSPPPGQPFGTLAWLDDHSLLTGVCGIGLALLAAIAPVEPRWDRVLAVAVPPQWSD